MLQDQGAANAFPRLQRKDRIESFEDSYAWREYSLIAFSPALSTFAAPYLFRLTSERAERS